MTTREKAIVTEAMIELCNMPTGAIGGDGPTLTELDEYVREHNRPMEDDACYHVAQRTWRILEQLLVVR